MSEAPDRTESIFAEAVAQASLSERRQYLDRACEDDAALRARIEALLRAHDRAGHLLDRPAASDFGRTEVAPSLEKPGAIVGGRYKLLEAIGEGGMGTVWMAEQKEPVKRKVAIKLVKAGMDSAQVLARFEAERQALALMDHPNIAKVLDGGVTEQGRPFFAMEFVKGVPLTTYCDRERLSLKERLNLFLPVCQAVQHAHQKGVIHRDLKPSNILVCLYDGEPVPKVIDFGLAKALHHSLTEQTLHTAFGTMVGTPLYMSPEQAEHNNLDVDIRTDIYSLGVMLYELLTGSTPLESQQLKVAAYQEILRLIKDVEPPKPSTRASGSAGLPNIAAQRSIDPKQLRKSLTGDLDWIVMKTLEKDRVRRYETVSALVEEIRRYLDGRPVEACPPSASYRLRKFAARHRTAVIVAAAFSLLIVGSSVASWILLAQARNARDQALRARYQSQEERNRALAAERIAAKHLRTATDEKERADAHARELKQRLYDYNINKAQTALREKQLTTAASFLGECLPEQRGWEWDFIHRLAKGARSLSLPSNSTLSFAIAPSGESLIAVDREGVARSIGLPDGRVRWSGKSDLALAQQCLFSPKGDRMLWVGATVSTEGGAAATEAAIIQMLDARDGKTLWKQRPTGAAAYEPIFSADGTQFLISIMGASGKAGAIELRRSQKGDLVWSLPTNRIAQAIFDKIGARIFVAESAGERIDGPSIVRCLKSGDREELWRIARSKETSGLLLSPRGDEILATGDSLSLVVFDTETGMEKARHKGPLADVGYLVRGCAPENHVLTVAPSGHCVVWDWETKQAIDESQVVCDPASLQLTPDGEEIAFMTAPAGALNLRPSQTLPKELVLIGHSSGFKGARFLDEDHLWSAGNERAMRLWRTSTGQELKAAPLAASALELDIAANGKWIALATTKGTKLWDQLTGQMLQEWPQDGQVWFVKFDAAGDTLATAGDQGVLRVYRAQQAGARWSSSIASPLHELKASAKIHGLAIAADGSTIYTLSSPGCEALAWDAQTGERQLLRPAEAGQTGRTAELSPDGRWLALGVEKTIELWDLQSRKMIARLKGPERNVLSLTFDRTGSRLFGGTAAGEIAMWNVNSQELLLSIQAHASYIVCLAMSPDNTTLASTSHGGEIKLWEARTLTSATVRERNVVRRATEQANRLLIKHRTVSAAVEELAKLDSSSAPELPIALAVLQARKDAPVNLQALAGGVGNPAGAAFDADVKLAAQALSLNARIEAAIGEDLAALQNATAQSPSLDVAARWTTLARTLLQKSRFNLELSEWISLLAKLTEGDDAPHYLLYLKAIAHVNSLQWNEGEVEFSRAIAAVPPKTPLWFEYAFRLAFLRAYVGDRDSYNSLASEALNGFSNSSDPILLERLAKICLFWDQASIDTEKAGAAADRAADHAIGGNSIYAKLTQAIADLRRKNHAGALERLVAVAQTGVPQSKDGHTIVVALAKMYASIACRHLNRDEEAQCYFDESAAALRTFPRGTGWWPDWMMAELAMREASALAPAPSTP